MGLQSDLGLVLEIPNAPQRMLQRIGATAVGTAVMRPLLGPLDRAVYKISRGRRSVGRSLGGLPVVMLTTIGARTGEQRTTPINAIPFEEDLALVGTNYGTGTTPGWAHNLRANPHAFVAHGGRERSVVAAEADDAQCETAFAEAIRVYAGYARYRRKAVNEVPVFILRAEVTA